MSASALKAAATGAATPEQARNPYEHLKRQLEISRGEFAKLVGGPANADKFIRVVLNAVLANTKLLDVSRASLIASCMKAAQDGLMPDGREAVLNIYSTKIKGKGKEPDRWEDKAQYLPMVGGLVKKLYASGEVTYIDAAVVYRGDVFRWKRGDTPLLEHEPALEYKEEDLAENGEPVVVAAYAVVKLKNGETKREVMTRHDINKVRNASKSKDSGPWATWFSEMAIKSVLKRINKQLPHSDAFEELARYDNEAMGYTGLGESVADIGERTTHDTPADQREEPKGIEHRPGEVLEPTLPKEGETVQQRADAVAEQVQQELDAAGGPLPAGVTPPQEQALATEIEVKMRAAASTEALDLQADRTRGVTDKALKLRLDEIYEMRAKELGNG